MIEKKDILKMAKHVFKRAGGGRDHEIMHPYREWGAGVLVALIIAIAGASLAVERYLTYSGINVEVSDIGDDAVKYRGAQVEQALLMYEDRKRKFENLVAEMPDTPPVEEMATSTIGGTEVSLEDGQASSTEDALGTDDSAETEVPEVVDEGIE